MMRRTFTVLLKLQTGLLYPVLFDRKDFKDKQLNTQQLLLDKLQIGKSMSSLYQ